MHIGCGTSDLGDALASDLGFTAVANVDFSAAAIDFQRGRAASLPADLRTRQQFEVGDATALAAWRDASFDAVVDKGTLDALMQRDDAAHDDAGRRMVGEVVRLLHPGGIAAIISIIPPAARLSSLDRYLAPHFPHAGDACCDVVTLPVAPFEVPSQRTLWIYVFRKPRAVAAAATTVATAP